MKSRLSAYSLLLTILFFGPSNGWSQSLGDNFSILDKHLRGEQKLSSEALLKLEKSILKNADELQSNHELISSALNLVKGFEDTQGPLFLNERTRGGYVRSKTEGIELDRVFFALQQALVDHAYTAENLEARPELFDKRGFQTADYYPGAVEANLDSSKVFKSRINASQPPAVGSPQNGEDQPVRRPTGWYLPAGEIAQIKVPQELVDKGYLIRVGAHSWDLKKKPKVTRLDRISLLFPVEKEVTKITNPLGGGVYIEVPALADAGLVTILANNLVESPFFSARSFDKTSLKDWKNIERIKKAPWADFESDRFMMQVPTSWIYKFDDPITMASHYDKSLDVLSDLTGRPKVRPKSVLYHQVDTTMRGGAFYPGYPQSNQPWNPLSKENGNKNHWFLKGPQFAPHVLFHEMGHHERITKFRGEVEAIVNFLYVGVHNIGYGVGLDMAFSQSLDIRNKKLGLDEVAKSWMVTQNFRDGKPMNITNRPGDEVKYQRRGYAKYVEIVNLFGWGAIQRFWKQDQLNYINQHADFPQDINRDPTDNRILRLSVAAGSDLRPLIHFWGVQPVDNKKLGSQMHEKGLELSSKVYDRLLHYKTVIPMSNEAFLEHAKKMFSNVAKPTNHPNLSNPYFGQGWYFNQLDKYSKADGERAADAIDQILLKYFPKGRPRW